MGGRASKQKGNRGEYRVRDYFRSLGYTANRVPSSGAAQGFKGDVEVSKDTEHFLVEVKCRKSSFKTIYALCTEHPTRIFFEGACIMISNNFLDLIAKDRTYRIVSEPKRTLKKVLTMRQLLKGCQYLVIKDDNKPLLFIKYE